MANHKIWLKSTDLFLTLMGLVGYAKGTINRPDSSQPRALANWEANDALAATPISSMIELAEWEYVDRDKRAKACWDALKLHHQSKGLI